MWVILGLVEPGIIPKIVNYDSKFIQNKAYEFDKELSKLPIKAILLNDDY